MRRLGDERDRHHEVKWPDVTAFSDHTARLWRVLPSGLEPID